MDEVGGPHWFAPKRCGYGGRPITWQGWLVVAVYVAIAAGAGRLLHDKPLALAGVLIPATAVLILIVAKTTRGGWQWRWDGRKSD